MKIQITVKERVVTEAFDLEVPAFRKFEYDSNDDGSKLVYFYKIIDAKRVIVISKDENCDPEQSVYHSLEFGDKLYAIDKRVLTLERSWYRCDEEEFNLELKSALAFFSKPEISEVVP